MNATKIKMCRGCNSSSRLSEIDEIYIEGIGYHKKDVVYDHLKKYPGSIIVGIAPYPMIVPERNGSDEKCIKSATGIDGYDSLLGLPKETDVRSNFIN